MHYLGIDWAVEKHDVCLMTDDGRVLSQTIIPNNSHGFEQLDNLIADLGEVAVNIERGDGPIVEWLVAHAIPVYITPSALISHRRPRRSKDDRGDAFLLAQLLRMKEPECRPVIRQSETVLHLSLLIKGYDDVVQEVRRETTRLVWTLRQYFPTAVSAFRVRYASTFLDFLEAYPTPEAARSLTLEELDRFLRRHRSPSGKRCSQIFAVLQTPMPTGLGETSYVEMVRLIIHRLRYLTQQRAYLHKQIVAVFKTHPDAAWWRTFPGASGPLTPARLLAAIGDNRDRFPTPQVLQAVAGTVPVTRRSGKQIRIEFRHGCSKPLRRAVDDLARQSVKHSGWARGYYLEQLARGHAKSRAFRALANRWMSIIWKLWKTGGTYCEAHHVANRSRRGQLMAA